MRRSETMYHPECPTGHRNIRVGLGARMNCKKKWISPASEGVNDGTMCDVWRTAACDEYHPGHKDCWFQRIYAWDAQLETRKDDARHHILHKIDQKSKSPVKTEFAWERGNDGRNGRSRRSLNKEYLYTKECISVDVAWRYTDHKCPNITRRATTTAMGSTHVREAVWDILSKSAKWDAKWDNTPLDSTKPSNHL
jgi:hypothetical protein